MEGDGEPGEHYFEAIGALAAAEESMQKKFEECKNELQAGMDAKAAELQAVVDAKAAELQAVVDTKAAELQAVVDTKAAELNTQLQELLAKQQEMHTQVDSQGNAVKDMKGEMEVLKKEVKSGVEEVQKEIAKLKEKAPAVLLSFVARALVILVTIATTTMIHQPQWHNNMDSALVALTISLWGFYLCWFIKRVSYSVGFASLALFGMMGKVMIENIWQQRQRSAPAAPSTGLV